MSFEPIRYSVRSLLLATAVVAVVCAIVARAPEVAMVLTLVVIWAVSQSASDVLGYWLDRRPAWLLVALLICGTALLGWAGYAWLWTPPAGAAVTLAAGWGMIFLLLAAALGYFSTGRR
jgi:hypothetical protein